MSTEVIVLHSGGQDSTTCLAWAIKGWGAENIHPVAFEYDQRHKVELEQAKAICKKMDVREPYVIPVEALAQLSQAALTNPDIAVAMDAGGGGNKFAESHGLPSTFIPGRNLLFLTLAAAYGAPKGIYRLVTGICEADATGYPDCRSTFKDAATIALSRALDDEPVTIFAPLLELSKAGTFALAEALGVLDIIIEDTHTCYQGNREIKHDWGYGCGQCPACLERAKGWATYNEKGLEVG